MNDNDKTVGASIEILGKIYPVKCPETEVQSLQQAAALLNQKMQEIQDSGKVLGLERTAIMVALNLAHQCLKLEQHSDHSAQKLNQRVNGLLNKLDETINKAMQTELLYIAD